METAMELTANDALNILREVMDPEVPVLDVVALGIVRGVEVVGDRATVRVTPTYSGCPAMRVIEREIEAALLRRGLREVTVQTVYSPPWTTDWLSDEAKERLRGYGIAPPGKVADTPLVALGPTVRAAVACPYCGSTDTTLKSEFGATACKAIHVCQACRQPFEEFKAL